METYRVVFEVIRAQSSDIIGYRTWNSYPNQKAFQDSYTSEVTAERRVVAEGEAVPTDDDAIRLCAKMPMRALIAAAADEADKDMILRSVQIAGALHPYLFVNGLAPDIYAH